MIPFSPASGPLLFHRISKRTNFGAKDLEENEVESWSPPFFIKSRCGRTLGRVCAAVRQIFVFLSSMLNDFYLNVLLFWKFSYLTVNFIRMPCLIHIDKKIYNCLYTVIAGRYFVPYFCNIFKNFHKICLSSLPFLYCLLYERIFLLFFRLQIG